MKKKIIPFVLLIFLSLNSFSTKISSTNVSYLALNKTKNFNFQKELFIVTADTVAIYKGPGSKYDQVGSLNKGDKVNVISKKFGSWYAIESNEIKGFLEKKFLKNINSENTKSIEN